MEDLIMLRATLDTNALGHVVWPERFPKDPRQSEFQKIRDALKDGHLQGFMCETLVTMEGIQRADRAAVLGGTQIRTTIEETFKDDEISGINIQMTPEQPARKPLHPQMSALVRDGFSLGIRLLRAPRIGWFRVEDLSGLLYPKETEEIMTERQKRFFAAAHDIQQRGLGFAQAQALGEKFVAREKVQEPWYFGLGKAKDVHEEHAVARAVAEWSDGDSVAAHIGYGFDLFCTEDQGKSAGGPSVFDTSNRLWLTQAYGVKFVTLSELAAML
jgi:hypothetical protein